jgi:hypothetical protein
MISHILSVAQLHNPRLTEESNDYTSDSLVHTDHDLMSTRQTALCNLIKVIPQTKFSYRRV